jgi:hypothetical protein
MIIQFPYQMEMMPMYDLASYNPRLGGNVYRITRKCGKANCRCAHSKRYWHPAWILEYTLLIKGKRIRKREYVPRAKVKALRQRIKRAKAKDRLRREQIRFFLTQTTRLLKRLEEDPLDTWAVVQLSQFSKDKGTCPVTEIQRADLVESLLTISNTLGA